MSEADSTRMGNVRLVQLKGFLSSLSEPVRGRFELTFGNSTTKSICLRLRDFTPTHVKLRTSPPPPLQGLTLLHPSTKQLQSMLEVSIAGFLL